MSAPVDCIQKALDAVLEPIEFFIRDDDAGWNAPALDRLLAVTAARGVVVDLAVIPAALTEDEAGRLLQFHHGTGVIRAHQHGYAHVNHEEAGRKCEFGRSRSATHQRADIRFGRRRLLDLLGELVDPIFTPPWNRCNQATLDALHEEGVACLSRNKGAEAMRLRSLVEVPVTTDWGKPGVDSSISNAQIARQIAIGAGPIGVMTHHAVLDDDALDELDALLALLVNHPNARFTTMGAIAGRLRDQGAATSEEKLSP